MTMAIQDTVARQLLEQTAAVEEELMAARAVQRFLLPAERVAGEKYAFSHVYQPLHHIGGDFLDVQARPDGSVLWLIADVAGHGISAAMSTALLKTAFMRYAGVATPGQLLTAMNRDLRGLVRAGRFVTAMAGLYEPGVDAGGRLTLASAGHPLPVLLSEGGASEITFSPEVPLLIEDEQVYGQAIVLRLRPGERVLAFTDGVLEAERGGGAQLGVEALCAIAAETARETAGEEFLSALYERLFFSELVIRDDVTLMMLECRDGGKGNRAGGATGLP